MKKQFLEAGKIVNTHGIRGEVKIQPWCDSPEFFTSFRVIYIDNAPVKVRYSRVQKETVIAALEGFDNIDDAIRLKNKTIFVNRDDIALGEGQVFIQDLIGIDVLNEADGSKIGTLTDVLTLPANDVYVIKTVDKNELLFPAVDEFVLEKNIDEGFVKVRLIEGL